MKHETIQDLQIPKIGFGTWSIGGGTNADRALDSKSLAALRSALKLGYTHFDTAEVYAAGHAEELIGQAVREAGVKRENLFITSKVSPEHLGYADVFKSCEGSLRRLGMDYLDLYLIHWPMRGMKLADTFRALNHLVKDGKVRHLGVSNFDLRLLKQARGFSETPLLTDQVPYSLAHRTYAGNGVLEYCQSNDILLTAYSPLKRNQSNTNNILLPIAKSHGTAPEQAALAWLMAQPCVIAIPMSFNPRHQKENLDAVNLTLSPTEVNQLNQL